MNISLIQTSHNAIGSIYICEDFLYNKDYLEFLKKIVYDQTLKSDLENLQNVKAKATDWTKLLKIEEMKNFHIRILHTLQNIYKLRTPTPNHPVTFDMTEAWGMVHKNNDHTTEHIHIPSAWSGAFYFDVPSPTYMNLPDFNESVQLKGNMLILFPGMSKHSVSVHAGEKERISMGFNISWKS